MRAIPQIKEFSLIFAYKYLKDPLKTLSECRKKYGDIFGKKSLGMNNYFICNPKHVEYILSTNQDNYQKHPLFINNFEPFLGKNNLLSSTNPLQWQRDRNLCKTAFEAEVFFDRYTKQLANNFNSAMNDWQKKYGAKEEPCPIAHLLDILGLKNINDTIFSEIDIDIESLVNHVPELFRLIMDKSLGLNRLAWIFPSRRKRKYEDEVRYIEEVKRKAFISRIKNRKNYDDLIGTLISEYKISGEGCPHFKDASDQMMTFDIVGFTTTTSALRWIVTSLIQNPEIEKRIEVEVAAICSDRIPTYADFETLKVTQATVSEILRLNPPLALIFREAIEKDEILDYPIPSKASVLIDCYEVHRHPEYWSDPETFNPDRFISKPYGQDFPYAYIPFGGGKRSCIGKNYAFLELCLFTAMFVQRFKASFPNGYQPKIIYAGGAFIRPDLDAVYLSSKH
jgi:cytochrome P450